MDGKGREGKGKRPRAGVMKRGGSQSAHAVAVGPVGEAEATHTQPTPPRSLWLCRAGGLCMLVVLMYGSVALIKFAFPVFLARLRSGCLGMGSPCALPTARVRVELAPSVIRCGLHGVPHLCEATNVAWRGGSFVVRAPSFEGTGHRGGPSFSFLALEGRRSQPNTYMKVPTEMSHMTEPPVVCDVVVKPMPMFYCTYMPVANTARSVDGQSPVFSTVLQHWGLSYDDGARVWGPGAVEAVALPGCFPILGRSGYDLDPMPWSSVPRTTADALPSSTTTYCMPKAIFNVGSLATFPDATLPKAPVPPPPPRPDRRFLVAVTACNSWPLTAAALDNLSQLPDPIDIVLIDDSSEDGTADRARSLGFRVISPPQPVGLTAGWNRAYAEFIGNPAYEALFIVNNDIVFPRNTFTRMADVLAGIEGPAVVGPMTTKHGLGKVSSIHSAAQNVELIIDPPPELLAGLPDTTAAVDDYVVSKSKPPHHVRTQWLLGYCMGVDRDMGDGGSFSETELFDPANRVVGQEDDLFSTRRIPAYAATNVFVYHMKGATLRSDTYARENIMMCHPGRNKSPWTLLILFAVAVLVALGVMLKRGVRLPCSFRRDTRSFTRLPEVSP